MNAQFIQNVKDMDFEEAWSNIQDHFNNTVTSNNYMVAKQELDSVVMIHDSENDLTSFDTFQQSLFTLAEHIRTAFDREIHDDDLIIMIGKQLPSKYHAVCRLLKKSGEETFKSMVHKIRDEIKEIMALEAKEYSTPKIEMSNVTQQQVQGNNSGSSTSAVDHTGTAAPSRPLPHFYTGCKFRGDLTHWEYECPNQPPQQQQPSFKRTNLGGVQQSSVQQLPPSQVKYPGAYGVAPNQMYYQPHQYAGSPQQQAYPGYQQQSDGGEQYNYQQFSAPPQPGSCNSE